MKTNLKNFLAALVLVPLASVAAPVTEPVDYVNPYIGSISHLLVPCFPTIQLPNSLMRIYPSRNDYVGEYLDGLPIVVTNHRERSAFRLSVTQDEELHPIIRTSWDHEKVTPYDYQVSIADNTIDVHLAVSHQSAIYELTFLDPAKPATILLYTEDGRMKADDKNPCGSQRLSKNMKIYFSGEFDVKPEQAGLLRDGVITEKWLTEEPRACGAFRFPKGTRKVQFRYGISLISEEQAEKNLRREQGKAFDMTKVLKEGRDEWNATLSNILVQGGTDNQKTVLYTSYYRTFERPVCLSEDGQYFSAFGGDYRELPAYGRADGHDVDAHFP